MPSFLGGSPSLLGRRNGKPSMVSSTMSMTCIPLLLLVLLWMTSSFARNADGNVRQPIRLALRGNNRDLRQVITATTCGNVRNPNDFPATLDVRYLYMVEYYGSLELNSLSEAIATSVASSLHSCNENGQPYFAVELTNDNEHQILTTGMQLPENGVYVLLLCPTRNSHKQTFTKSHV
jgi:hypothetical protein